MDLHWVHPGKLAIPPVPESWLPRDLGSSEPARLLVAGPGYGKTCALAALAHERQSAGDLVLWLSLDEADDDPVTFLGYLVAAMRAHIPRFAEGPGLAVADFHQAWRRFLQALATYDLPPVTLVLDDVHHLDAAAALTETFGRLPANFRLYAASRQRWPRSLAKLRARGQLALIEQDALRLAPEECAGADPALEGWPLGVVLRKTDAYVAEELYLTHDERTRRFMREVSVLESLDPAACAAVAGSSEPLQALEDAHLVVAGRFPAYLREFLRGELAREPSALARAHGRAAAHFGPGEAALGHLVAARDWASALEQVPAVFPRLVCDERRATLRRWLDAFPADIRADSPLLQLWEGIVAAHAGRYDEAVRLYEQAERGFRAADDVAGELKALVRQATAALLQQQTRRFNRLLLNARARAEAGRPEDLADLALLQALAAEQRGDMALMREHNQDVLAIPGHDNLELDTCRCVAHLNLFTAALHAGELSRAGRHLEDLAAIASARGFTANRMFATVMQAHLALLRGEVERAGSLLAGLPGGWEHSLDWHSLGCALTTCGAYQAARGDHQAAEKLLRRSLAVFEEADFLEGRKVPLEHLLWLMLQRRQYAAMAALAPQEAPRNVFDAALAIPLARGAQLAGRPAEAIARLEAAEALLAEQGALLHLARARLYLAAARPDGTDSLNAARVLIERHDFGFLRTQDADLWQALATLESAPAPGSAADLTIRCFGPLEVRRGDLAIDAWPRRKAKLALVALVLKPAGLLPFELAELLDPDQPSINTVRVTITALRKQLEPGGAKGDASRYLPMVDGRYLLAPGALAFVDLAAFGQAMDQARRHLRAGKPDQVAAAYEAALAVYRGDLADDPVTEGHFEAEREHCRRQALDALAWLARHGDPARREAALARAVALAPADEEACLAYMGALADAGRPELARQTYWDCRRALRERLDAAPSPELEAAYRAL